MSFTGFFSDFMSHIYRKCSKVSFLLQVAIPLGQITSPPLLKSRVLGVKQTDGQTYTGHGLRVMQQMFQENPRNGTGIFLYKQSVN